MESFESSKPADPNVRKMIAPIQDAIFEFKFGDPEVAMAIFQGRLQGRPDQYYEQGFGDKIEGDEK